MDSHQAVSRLLEDSGDEDDPINIGPLDKYVAPVALNVDVKDILEHAMFLKSQAEEAGVLDQLRNTEDRFGPKRATERNINRALLYLACKELENEV